MAGSGIDKDRIRNLFKPDCQYHWNGEGEVPLGTLLLATAVNSQVEACWGCPVIDCKAREDKETGYAPSELDTYEQRLGFKIPRNPNGGIKFQ